MVISWWLIVDFMVVDGGLMVVDGGLMVVDGGLMVVATAANGFYFDNIFLSDFFPVLFYSFADANREQSRNKNLMVLSQKKIGIYQVYSWCILSVHLVYTP